MKFCARFVARALVVCAGVALIIGLGFVWKESPLAGIVADDRTGQLQVQSDGFGGDRRLNDGFSFANASDLIQTFAILGGIVAAVVVIDKVRGNPRIPADLRVPKPS